MAALRSIARKLLTRVLRSGHQAKVVGADAVAPVACPVVDAHARGDGSDEELVAHAMGALLSTVESHGAVAVRVDSTRPQPTPARLSYLAHKRFHGGSSAWRTLYSNGGEPLPQP
jgi:hypothetical protein